MSMRISDSSVSNRKPASALHSSVLPTPVGPRNMKEPYGRFGSRQAGARTADRVRHRADRLVLADHAFMQLLLDMQQLVALALHHARDRDAGGARDHLGDLLGADLGAQQLGPRRAGQLLSPCAASACFSCASSSGRRPYCSSETRCQFEARVASSISRLTSSISSLMCVLPCATAFSAFQDFLVVVVLALQARDLFLDQGRRLPEASSFSRATASRSIFSWIRRRSSLSITSGLESISILIFDAASSIRSIALSGRKRSVI
jgi:hypothetical protein